jgi:excisionase family DNA binding protein
VASVTEQFVDAHAVAARLGVPITWVREATRAGTIPHYRFGRYVRYVEEEVLAWAASCRNGGRPVRLRTYAGRIGKGPRGAQTPEGRDTRR